jgi:hypothetical protein
MRPVLVALLAGLLLVQGGCAHNQEAVGSAQLSGSGQAAAPCEQDCAATDQTLRKYSWSDSWLENHPILNVFVSSTEGMLAGILLCACGLVCLGVYLLGMRANSPASFSPYTH